MEHEKKQPKRLHRRQKRRRNNRSGVLLLSLLMLITTVIGGTLAYLVSQTQPLTNTFEPSVVDCEVTERFDGAVKKDVNVRNTGDTDAYLRVRLVAYRVNEQGQHIGGEAQIPAFALGDGWVKNGNFYYYTKPVAPNSLPASSLTEEVALNGLYEDADGGKQVIEVMAEAIQAKGVAADGTKAVVKAWGIDPETLS